MVQTLENLWYYITEVLLQPQKINWASLQFVFPKKKLCNLLEPFFHNLYYKCVDVFHKRIVTIPKQLWRDCFSSAMKTKRVSLISEKIQIIKFMKRNLNLFSMDFSLQYYRT